MRKITMLMTGAVLAFGASAAFAQSAATHDGAHEHHQKDQGHAGHHDVRGGAAPSGGAAEKPASTQAYIAANNRMHTGMMVSFTGDADVDFMRGMIPHHQGAIDMARIVLEHGSDPEVRKLAEAVIAAQEAEIAMMKKWLSERGR